MSDKTFDLTAEQLLTLDHVGRALITIQNHKNAPDISLSNLHQLGKLILDLTQEIRGKRIFNSMAKERGWNDQK